MAEAKSIVKNKFWIVEENGSQIATIQATNNGVVFVNANKREKFNNIKMLTKQYNINFLKNKNTTNNPALLVYDYPSDVTPYNKLYDLKSKLPLYTKNNNSKCYYCAGYYLVNVNNNWRVEFCPKRVVLIRQKYIGPFSSSDIANNFIEKVKSSN